MPAVARRATLSGSNCMQQELRPVRAAILAASIVGVGLYLGLAAAFAFSPTWIGLGVLAIALIGAVLMVLSDAPETQTVR